jgi:hypothetical protein
MAQQAPPPPKGLGTINWRDLWKGLYYAAIGQILALIAFLVTSLLQEIPHFPTWVEWLPYIKGTAVAIGGYLAGKFGVNNVGQILKKDRPVVKIDVETLNDLKDNAK